jgi:PAS domain S-box-containing protein
MVRAEEGGALLLLGRNAALLDPPDLDALAFPLLVALLQAESVAITSAGLAAEARTALAHATTLAGSLDTARAELARALAEADRLNRALQESNTTLEARVAERTRALDRAWRLSPDLRVIAGTDGVLTAVNGSWTDLLGWKAPELLGHSFVEFTHPDDLAATQDVFADLVATPLTDPYEYRLRHADGSYRWFS